MSERAGGNNRLWRRRIAKRARRKGSIKFHASVNNDMTLTLYQREGGLYLIIKKELTNYPLTINASEAPVINQYLKNPDPFESVLADIKILEKEVDPINLALQTNFGEDKEFSLVSVKLAVGSGEHDYVTIDESDLYAKDVEPTMSGILDYASDNDTIIGLCDRVFDHEKGNIILLEAKSSKPFIGISTIDLKLMSSLQQRGLYLQKSMQYAGLQLYTIIKAEELSKELLNFLKSIGIDWEVIFLRRDIAIEDWTEVECEKNSISLKGYLASKYEYLGFFDVNNITRVAVINQLNFKVVNRIAELLNCVKESRQELTGATPDNDPLKKAEIIAAARLSCAYFGINKEIKIDKEIDLQEVQYFEAELIKL
ncbi:MAG: hypothetical protein ACTSVU_04965 [Promethearchaeota archaeon]